MQKVRFPIGEEAIVPISSEKSGKVEINSSYVSQALWPCFSRVRREVDVSSRFDIVSSGIFKMALFSWKSAKN